MAALSLSFVAHVWHLLWEALSFVLLIAVIFLCCFPFFLAWLFFFFFYFCCKLNKTAKWILNWEERLQRCLNATSQAHPHILPLRLFEPLLPLNATRSEHTCCVSAVSQIGFTVIEMFWTATSLKLQWLSPNCHPGNPKITESAWPCLAPSWKFPSPQPFITAD